MDAFIHIIIPVYLVLALAILLVAISARKSHRETIEYLQKWVDDCERALKKLEEEAEPESVPWPTCNGCGEPAHPNYPCEEAKGLRS
jgi:hypothetical protein